MTMRLSRGKNFATLVSTYASNMTTPDEIKNKFYEELNAVITTVSNADRLIILGDLNTRVGCDSAAWEGVIWKHVFDICNSNGVLLLQTCAGHDHKHVLLPPQPLCRRGRHHQEEGYASYTWHKGYAPHHRKTQATNAAKKTAAGLESTKMPECQQNEGRHHQAVLCCHLERTPRAHLAE